MSNVQLLLLHGALGCQKQFKKLKSLLSEHVDVYAFDFSGHGGKPIIGKYDIIRFKDELADFVTKQQLSQPKVFGYSMGGYVALKLAAENQQVLGDIMTLGTKLDWNPDSADKEARMLNADKIEEKVPAFAQRLETLHAPTNWKEVVNETRDLLLGLGDSPALTKSDFSNIQNKVLIGLGSEDKMVSEAESKRAAELIPNAEFEMLEGFKHPIDLVDANNLAKVLLYNLL